MSAMRFTGPAYRGIEGQTSEDECAWLLEAAKRVGEGCIVEVGSFRGRTAAALAEGARAGFGADVYAVDPHDRFVGVFGGEFGPADRAEFCRNLDRAGLLEAVHLIGLPSERVAPCFGRTVGLLWIDGDHAYDSVRRDFDLWRPWLSPRAVVAFHDTDVPEQGPARVVSELTAESGEWTLFAEVERLQAITRRFVA